MKYQSYQPETIEPEIRSFWDEEKVLTRLRERIHDTTKKPFYFLDGPPYTSGQVHIGTAWNKTMKDFVVRLRRMQGLAVWDRAGYDMHGLPNENATMKQLGLQTNEDIEAYGIHEFIQACKQRGITNLEEMNKDFLRLGISLDFTNAYQTISDEWIETVWHLIQEAHKKGRLYEADRPMAWDPVHESALAKHELEYKTVEDNSIYVKFKRVDEDEYFIVWTTTPWTIPFNLMIMVNPELTYARVRVGEETWIIAEALVQEVLQAAEITGEVTQTFPGEELIGAEYTHFFSKELDYASIKEQHPNTHTIVASTEYVTTEAGSGLVHAAPGCGPEDYEVGVQNNVPAWNLLTSKGSYPANAGVFSNKNARADDEHFIQEIRKQKALVAEEKYVHEYPHAERSKAAVVYKATKQWFFKIDDIKEELIAANNGIQWNPQAAYNAFNSWLENLRDNSITKQRFFGTPIPLWRSEDGDVLVIGSKEELKTLAGQEITDLHKPAIDEITIRKNGKEYTRIPDVVDVWVDAGVAHMACLGYPQNKEVFKRFWPADFIIEGNDQVRGWFNLLLITSMLTQEQAPFKNVYMHGMIQDAKGRKMSKSLGNYIAPDEVIDAFGADASRLYFLSQARAGNDLVYNAEDVKQKQRELLVYWNIHKYLLDLHTQTQTKPSKNTKPQRVEDRYILSLAHSTLQEAQKALDNYDIERVVHQTEKLLQEISRTYIQFIRSREDTQTVLDTLHEAYLIALQLLSACTPYITEAIYQNLQEILGYTEVSIHETQLPKIEKQLIDTALQEEMLVAQRVISAVLAARDVAQIGVRWPLAQASVQGVTLSKELEELVLEHTNIKELAAVNTLEVNITLEPNYSELGRSFGKETNNIAQELQANQDKYSKQYAKEETLSILGHELTAKHVNALSEAPKGYSLGRDASIQVLLKLEQTPALLEEGYRREFIRRVQQARKEADLEKTDKIILLVGEKTKQLTEGFEEEITTSVGASDIRYENPSTAVHYVNEEIKEQRMEFGFFTE
ncbi:MAG: isoleucine--tRNA ligase [Candidatus Woesearchaeota archaeon]